MDGSRKGIMQHKVRTLEDLGLVRTHPLGVYSITFLGLIYLFLKCSYLPHVFQEIYNQIILS